MIPVSQRLTREDDVAGIDIDDALAEEMAEPPPTKFVFRLLQKEDMNRALVGRYVSAMPWV